MKFSMHTIIVSDYPTGEEHLLYNTRTQALVKISQELKEVIEDFNLRTLLLREKYVEDLSTLYAMGILVDTEEEDIKKLKSHLDNLKYGVKKSMFAVTILTTYACNLKCTYCFQESSRTNVKMDHETSVQAMNWIKAQVKKMGYEELYLNFYGGEPLVNKPALERIAAHMKEWCRKNGVSFKFMMQTNGYLMTSELIDKYLELGLQQVRISVDGVGEDHDQFRPLRKGGGTFDVIMKNIVDCVDKVKIGISVSYDKGDISAIDKLLNYFDDLGILHKMGRFIFSPIHATLGPKDHPEMIQNSSCMCNYENDNLADSQHRIMELMKSKGLPTKSGMSTAACPLTRAHTGSTIDQHGRLYKCNSMLGHPELSTGHVRDNDYNEKYEEFLHLDVWEQCPVDCTYMPMCGGGCRLSSFLNNKNFKTPTCHKPYLNKMARELIIKDYEQMRDKRNEKKQKKELARV